MRTNLKDLKQIDDFAKEKDKFYLLSLIIQTEESTLCSNNKDYIIGRCEENLPTWIWTSDALKDESYNELKLDLKNLLVKGNNKITCKKELYERLSKDFNIKNYFEMGYLSCEKLIKPKERVGIFVRPNYKDKVLLANYFQANEKEISNKELSINEALEDVELWLKGKRFYVLVDRCGKIVSMAGYSVLGDRAKITHVYTPIDERRKGYCTNLIYELTKLLEDEGYKPLLYTDHNYEASNNAYKKLGYKDEGILINFEIDKE